VFAGVAHCRIPLASPRAAEVPQRAAVRGSAAFCTPYSGSSYDNQMEKLRQQQERQSDAGRPKQLRSELNQRRDEERLPDETAFWELVRIAFAEKPQTFSDAIRLHQFRILILTGMRVGEIATLPMDTLRRAEHLVAGEARSTFLLRHFAEKQTDDRGRHGIQLVEAFQPVPQIFEETLQESISEVLRLTAPLRSIFRAQRSSGRLLPELPSTALVPTATPSLLGWGATTTLPSSMVSPLPFSS